MKGYVSKWEHALKVAKADNQMNAIDEEIKRLASRFLLSLLLGWI